MTTAVVGDALLDRATGESVRSIRLVMKAGTVVKSREDVLG